MKNKDKSDIQIKTSDGHKLAVIYKNLPDSSRVVIMAHGMTVNKDDEGIFVRAERELNDLGISTIRFDFRAHGESTGKSEKDFTISGELKDMESVVQFAIKEGYEWIGLAGASFGGGIAALYTGENQSKIHALLLANPVLDYEKAFLKPSTSWAKKHFENVFNRLEENGYIKIGSRQFKVGKQLFEEMKKYFPFINLEKYQEPLLIIHGIADSKVSYQDAKDVYQKLSNTYKSFETIDKSEHGFHDEPFETMVTDHIVEFFKEKSKSFFTQNIRTNCISSADDFIKSAKKIQKSNLPHIQYHLSALALEEIGKAELVIMQHVVDDQSATNFESSSMDDHVRKLFWAFWGPNFGKHLMTEQELDSYKGLAQTVHWTRLNSLYTNTYSVKPAKENVTQNEADQLLSLAEARLGMEQHREFEFDKEDPDKEELKWFLDATQDLEKRDLVFGGASHKKLVEFQGDARKWVKWLKKQFDDNNDEIRKIVEEELGRKKPQGKEASKPKYKIKIKLYSDSHSIRKKVLNEWNNKVDFIHLDTDDKRTLYCTLNLSKIFSPHGLWLQGWGIARSFAIALNIATRGFIWWNVEKDIEKYYEEIWDVEKKMRLEARPKKRLAVNWKDLRWTLKERDLAKTSVLLAFVTDSRGKPMEQALGRYAFGLALTSKNDFHLRTETEAFIAFYLSLKDAMKINRDWNGTTDYIEAVKKVFSQFGDFPDMRKLLSLGEELVSAKKDEDTKPVTLTEVFGMKIYVDVYFDLLASKMPKPSKSKKSKNKVKNAKKS